MKGITTIEQLFKEFYAQFTYLEIGEALEYFAFFGGIEDTTGIDLFDALDDVMLHQVLVNLEKFEAGVSPSYVMEPPYRKLLIAVARGDGKLFNVFRRARINETSGGELINELVKSGVLYLEQSREPPLKSYPGQKIKKHLRTYRIQSKVRFRQPFLRFWFGFVEPYKKEIASGRVHTFMENFRQHQDRCAGLVFEQLSNDLLQKHFAQKDPLVSSGSFWDRHSEFDIFAVTRSGSVILGECKYRGRKVCKNELNKLREKALQSGISVDTYALFSRNGFSNELKQSGEEGVLLFEPEEFRRLLF